MQSPMCAPAVVANDAWRPIASETSTELTVSRPTPPKSSGTSTPSRPSSPHWRINCRATAQSFASSASRRGMTSCSMNACAVAEIIRCSSLRSSGVNTAPGDVSPSSHAPPNWEVMVMRASSRCTPISGRRQRSSQSRRSSRRSPVSDQRGDRAQPIVADVETVLVDVQRDVLRADLVGHLLRVGAHVLAARVRMIERVLHRGADGALGRQPRRRRRGRRARRCRRAAPAGPSRFSHQSPRSITFTSP